MMHLCQVRPHLSNIASTPSSRLLPFFRMLTLPLFQSDYQSGHGQYPSSPVPVSSLASGPEVATRWDEQGFPVLVTIDPAATPAPKSFDSKGFLITSTDRPVAPASASIGVGAVQADGTSTTGFMFPSAVPANEARQNAVLWNLIVAVGMGIMATVAVI
jgi:hypothetical protein